MQVEEAVELIQMEYQEMPELRLTFWQARRLWNLSDELCERALSALTGSGFLVRAPDGAYVRRGIPRESELALESLSTPR